jgi:hypothetical protein
LAKFNVKKHDKVVSKATAEMQADMFDAVKALENQVADIVALGLPPEAVRPQILAAIDTNSQTVKTAANTLATISEDFMSQNSAPAGPEDFQSQSQLLALSSDELVNAMKSSGEDVVKTVVLGTVAGLGTAMLVQQARGRISGIHMESTDPDVRREQRNLRKLVKAGASAAVVTQATNKLKRKLPGSVNTAGSIVVKLSTSVDNVVGSYNGTYAKAQGTRNGVEMFEYVGGIMATSRPFCVSMVGSIMNAEDIQNLWDGSGWAGKEPGDPFVVRGGYNCNHYWVPVDEEN